MSRARSIKQGLVNHIYENTVDGKLLFYSTSDYLVFFSLFCITAVRYDVTVLSLCLMPDHFHAGLVERRQGCISGMMRDVLSQFTRQQNQVCGTKGPLFRPHYGSAVKRRDKDVRFMIIYIDNNPVERHLCETAEQYRWNFLAYARSPNPFSDPLVIRKASYALRTAVYYIKRRHKGGHSLAYWELHELAAKLTPQEKNQLTDFIVTTYSVIRYDEANRYFDSLSDRLAADHSVSAREYDLNEVFVGKSDAYYTRMIARIMKETGVSDIHQVLSWPEERKRSLFNFLARNTSAPRVQIAKLLRLPF